MAKLELVSRTVCFGGETRFLRHASSSTGGDLPEFCDGTPNPEEPGTEICVDGVCGCRAGLVDCGGECVDIRIDAEHCGSCSNDCGERLAPLMVTLRPVCPNATVPGVKSIAGLEVRSVPRFQTRR